VTGIIGDVILTKYVIDSVQYSRPFSNVLIFIIIVAGFFIITSIFSSIFNSIYVPIVRQKISKKMQQDLFSKAMKTDLQYYDDPTYYNSFIISLSNADSRTFDVFNSFITILTSVFTIVGIIGIIITVDPICIIFVAISILTSLIINLKRSKITYEQDMESKPIERKRSYIQRVFYLIDYSKEIRTSPVKTLLMNKYNKESDNACQIIRKYSGKNFRYSFIDGFLINTLIIDILYFSTLIIRASIQKVISYGSIAGMINAAWSLNNSFQTLKNVIPQLALHSLYIEKLRDFLNLPSTIKVVGENISIPTNVNEISFSNCNFKYPCSDLFALHNINFSITNGQKIAIVGHNGAGKTTLLKLLLRFYDPTEGSIGINNINIKHFIPEEYRNNIGTVFQDFKLFAFTIGENVLMDNLSSVDTDKVILALKNATFDKKMSSLEHNIDTPITNEFSDSGTFLSGGQEQMIAIARVFVKNNLFIILDEASSALDPLTELKVNEKLFELSKGKTVIFISHRLTITQYVDKIYVLSDGSIIESGNHNELILANKEYAKMYKLQAEKYRL
jgi:ATP-binding cassette subfamily B protein